MASFRNSQEDVLKERMKQLLFVEKLNNPPGYILLVIIAALVSYVVGTQGFRTGLIFLSGISLFPALLLSTFSIRFGVVCIIVVSYFVIGVKRYMPEVDWGLSIDVLLLCLLLGTVVKKTTFKDWNRHPLHIGVAIWILYCLLQALNPLAGSQLAWLYAYRSIGGVLLLYFFAYHSIFRLSYIRLLSYLLIALGCICALYGLKQVYWGLFRHEIRWLYDAPALHHGLLSLGKFRAFSVFSSPVIFGIMMALHSLICLVLMLEPGKKGIYRLAMGVCAALGLWAMLYSGTRTAYVLVPIGLCIYAMLSLRKEVIVVIAIIAGIGFSYLHYFPDSPISYRLSYVFQPQKYIEFLQEKTHKQTIQPLVRDLPLGLGIGSTGYWAKRFSPDTHAATIAPKDGYAMLGVEMGWVGLLLFLGLMFLLFKESLHDYFHSTSPQIKHTYAVYFVVVISILVANLSHMLINQKPVNILFAVSLAILAKLRFVEEDQAEAKIGSPGR